MLDSDAILSEEGKTMAEIIGITASVLTLIQAAGLAIDGACALKRKIDGAPKALDSAIEYLELIRLKLVLLQLLATDPRWADSGLDQNVLERVDAGLKTAARRVETLHAACDRYCGRKGRLASFRWPLDSAIVKKLLDDIRSTESAFLGVFHIIQMLTLLVADSWHDPNNYQASGACHQYVAGGTHGRTNGSEEGVE
jgi:hypothetical protein